MQIRSMMSPSDTNANADTASRLPLPLSAPPSRSRGLQTVVLEHQADVDRMLCWIAELQVEPRKTPVGFYSVTVEPGVATLVEPVNGTSYVYVPPATLHCFESTPSSGTDKLRQRMAAAMCFASIVDQARLREANTEPEPNAAAARRPHP